MEGQGFTEAKNLNAGDEVRTADGATAEVENVETVKLDKPVKVYNFEVEDFHTYYVSEQMVLVHNTCAVTTKNKSLKRLAENKTDPQPTVNFVLGKGSTVRKVSYSNIRNHALKKHFTGNGKDSLKVLDPDGTTDKWMPYINELATTGEGVTKQLEGGELLEIMGKMPKTGGGELDIGVRLYRANDSSKWSLRTVLTRQH